MLKPSYYSDWYADNRERLLPIRRKYNKEYSQRAYVIIKAKEKNAKSEHRAVRKKYKQSSAGKRANTKYRNKPEVKAKYKNYRLLVRYGLTQAMVDEMKEGQANKCAICGNSILLKFHIDHDHDKNKVRGLLCTSCNMGLGLFKDDTGFLLKAINYLKNGIH